MAESSGLAPEPTPIDNLAKPIVNLDLDWNHFDGYRPTLLFDDQFRYFSPVYGIVADPEFPNEKVGVPLEQLEEVHKALHETILAGEGGFVAKVTQPPEPLQVTGSKANTDAWLGWINQGVWPMPLHNKRKVGSFVLDTSIPKVAEELEMESFVWDHDYRNKHLGNLVLFPKETTDRLRLVAGIASDRRLHHDDQPLILPGEAIETDGTIKYEVGHGAHHLDYDYPPYGSVDVLYNGARLIDQVTDQSAYLQLLARFVSAPDEQTLVSGIQKVEEMKRQGTLRDFMSENLSNGNEEVSEQYKIWSVFSEFALANIALENFIVRHTKQRNLTSDEQKSVFDEALASIVRVAQKIKAAA